MGPLITLGVILFIILVVVLSSIKIVNTGYLYVVERFGQFYKVLETGWHIIIPFVDYVRKNKIELNFNFLATEAKEYNIPLELNLGRVPLENEVENPGYPNSLFWDIATDVGNGVVVFTIAAAVHCRCNQTVSVIHRDRHRYQP